MLAVDARWMLGSLRGMGRYAHALLEPVRQSVLALLPNGRELDGYSSVGKGSGFFPHWEQFVLPRMCADYGVDELLCPYNTGPISLPSRTRLTLVVHDLIYLEPWTRLAPSVSAYQTLGRIYRRMVVPRVASKAGRLITVSEYTRGQMVSRLGIAAERVVVIPNSLPDSWYVDEALSQGERDNYVLCVAGEAPSKNLPNLIAAYGQFRRKVGGGRSVPGLRIVGVQSRYHEHFRRLAVRAGVGDLVQFHGFVDESELRQLYRRALLFVMPSLYEGFGIPLLEAMASGTPVACSDTTSLPEVVGDAGWLFNPRNVSAIASCLQTACIDIRGRAERAALGLERAGRFRRSVVAAQILEFWSRNNTPT